MKLVTVFVLCTLSVFGRGAHVSIKTSVYRPTKISVGKSHVSKTGKFHFPKIHVKSAKIVRRVKK